MQQNFTIFDNEKDELDIDLIITIGGDGTILWAVSLFQKRDVPPIIGISKVIFIFENFDIIVNFLNPHLFFLHSIFYLKFSKTFSI